MQRCDAARFDPPAPLAIIGAGVAPTLDPSAAAELAEGLPFVDFRMTEAKEFGIVVEQVYGSDRDAIPKGVIKVVHGPKSRRQLENTVAKLRLLEARLDELDHEPVTNARTRELTRLSLKKLIN